MDLPCVLALLRLDITSSLTSYKYTDLYEYIKENNVVIMPIK